MVAGAPILAKVIKEFPAAREIVGGEGMPVTIVSWASRISCSFSSSS
jgi:hypothetical protein